ncbi:MAG: FecR domain-containing protein [Bacteroidota bacterium]
MHTSSANSTPGLPETLRDHVAAQPHASALETLWAALEDPTATAAFPSDDTAWADLNAQLNALPAGQPQRAFADRAARPQSRQRRGRWTLATAGLTMGVLLLGLAWFVQPVVVTMPMGETAEVTLPDGSVAHLNSGSQLTYARGFQSLPGVAASTRTVQLAGEGYFSVTHHPEQPFHVQTSTAQIEVLGTQFNVREVGGATEVVLAEGEVQVTASVSPSDAVVLNRPGASAVVTADAAEQQAALADVALATAWRAGGFVMIDATVAEVLNALQRTFAMRITAAEGLVLDDTVTLIYQRGATLEGVLRDLCLSQDCTFRPSSQGYTVEAR